MKLKKLWSSLLIATVVSAMLGVGVLAAETPNAITNNGEEKTQTEQSVNQSSNGQTTDNQNATDGQNQQAAPSITYKVHMQRLGTMPEVKDGALAGKTGKSLRMEALWVNLKNVTNGSVEYAAHVQGIGWQKYKKAGDKAGTTGSGKRVEAIKIQLTGDIANQYDVYYRVHIQHYGWLNWTSDGNPAGSAGKALRIEALQIKLVKKGQTVTNDPVNIASTTNKPFIYDMVSYQAHVQRVGTQNWVSDGALAGTTGRGLRVEGIALKVADPSYLGVTSGGIKYRVHAQTYGWMPWQENGKYAGTQGKGKRVEALQIELTGDLAQKYDVYYTVHVQRFGDLAWGKNGQAVGTEGLALRVEGIHVILVKKGSTAPSNNGRDNYAYLTKDLFKNNVGVRYQTYVQSKGWTNWQTSGASGTTGQSKRVEAYRVAVDNKLSHNAYITYHSHIQGIGDKQKWQDSRNAGAYSGTIGQSKRVEAIQMNLNGYAASVMDVYYRVYTQRYGWLGWAKNGEWAGTSNGGLRVEAIQIALRMKTEGAPGSTANHYKKIVIDNYPQANAVLNHIGRNLRAAYNWSAGLKYWRQYYSPNMGTRWYANIGFSQHRGNCYVMAATFTEMARALGYNAHQVVGYVPHIGGGDAPHSWVEIDEKDGTWVYDPNLTNELHLPGYHFKYGHAKTWRYYRYHRTKLK